MRTLPGARQSSTPIGIAIPKDPNELIVDCPTWGMTALFDIRPLPGFYGGTQPLSCNFAVERAEKES